MTYYWETDRSALGSVYGALLGALTGNNRDDADNAEQAVINMEANGVLEPAGELSVEYGVVNYIVYKEIVVTATRTIPMPVDLSFVGFPSEIPVTVTSTAVVQNGDEFVRNMDIAADFVKYLDQRFGISTSEAFVRVKEVIGKLTTFLQGKG